MPLLYDRRPSIHFKRKIDLELQSWKSSLYRKPLVIRGARQVGKTTAVKAFGQSFDTFIHLDLELEEDKRIFENDLSFADVLQRLFLEKKQTRGADTLIFIDEIQNSPRAVELMRYFYELEPDLYVISAGSLLEIMMDSHRISFPVGRVEYLYMMPLSFEEFLEASGEEEALELFNSIPLPDWALPKMFELFHRYALIGGMPEIVSRYINNKDVASLTPVYQGLLTAYRDDVSKYAKNSTETTVIRHVIDTACFEAGRRVTFEKFGNSPYRSREVGDALRTLERAMLIYLRYPTTHTSQPLVPDLKKKPRLQFLDTGQLNYGAGLQGQFFAHKDLHSFYNGILAEHITAQELMAVDAVAFKKPLFWVRELRQSNAEVDALLPYKQRVVPVEVKSGKSGTLRSLHSFIDISGSDIAVRLYSSKIELIESRTPDKTPYRLLSLPYFLASKISAYLDYFFK